MRIEQIGGGTGVSGSSQAQKVSVAKSSSPSKVQQVKPVRQTQKPTMQERQKMQHVQAEAAAVKSSKENEQQVISAIEKANKQFRTFDRKLEFSIHEGTKEIMVKVINTADDSVIREIPSEKVLDMVAHMWEIAGILVDEKR